MIDPMVAMGWTLICGLWALALLAAFMAGLILASNIYARREYQDFIDQHRGGER